MALATRVHEKLSGTKNGIHAVEVVAEILLQLSYFRQPTSLKILSERCGLSPSMVHRYLSSLIKLGLIFQGQKSGFYSLGRNAVLLGLAAIQQMDQVDDVMEELSTLVKEVNCHVAITVWSKTGPTIIRWERSEDRLAVPMQLGQVLPVLHSASGRVFAAFLDASLTRDLIAEERLSYGDSNKQSDEELQCMLMEVRQNRCAVSKGEVESETTAISTPVVDWQDSPILVLTAVVSKNSNDDRILAVLSAMRRFSDQKSIRKPSFPFEAHVPPGQGLKSQQHQNGSAA
ncbi:MAG: IclR family transcriptional regulator C-terminal domain-containing protein [Verrucomicrobiota bacterium]